MAIFGLKELLFILVVYVNLIVNSSIVEASYKDKTHKTNRGEDDGTAKFLTVAMDLLNKEGLTVKNLPSDIQENLNKEDKQGRIFLYYALKQMRPIKEIRSLVKIGADLFHTDKGGNNLPFQLIKNNLKITPDMIKYFLSKGLKLFKSNLNGDTILSEIINTRNNDAMKALFNGGIDVNVRDDKGNTMLYYLLANLPNQGTKSMDDSLKIMKHLIKLGANVNFVHQDKTNNTILHYAAIHGTVEMIELLLINGAKVNQTNGDGDSPVHVILPLNGLSSRWDKIDSCIHKFVTFLEFSPDLDLKNKNGQVPNGAQCFLFVSNAILLNEKEKLYISSKLERERLRTLLQIIGSRKEIIKRKKIVQDFAMEKAGETDGLEKTSGSIFGLYHWEIVWWLERRANELFTTKQKETFYELGFANVGKFVQFIKELKDF